MEEVGGGLAGHIHTHLINARGSSSSTGSNQLGGPFWLGSLLPRRKLFANSQLSEVELGLIWA